MTPDEDQGTRQSLDTIEAERGLFRHSGIWRVRILGINALGLLHRHASDLIEVLRNGGTVEVLLLDPETAKFRKRRDAEEKRGGMVSDRLEAEMGASTAMLRDILNLLLHEHGHDIETLEERFRIRLHGGKSKTPLLFVETTGGRFLLHRKLPLVLAPSYDSSTSTLIALDKGEASTAYDKALKRFHETRDGAEGVSLDHLKSNFRIVAPRKKDVSHIYAQAVEFHRQRRLDEAASLYETTLKLEPPGPPTDEQVGLVRRFLPRVFVTPEEPFKLRDLIAIVHPDRKQRLIGYHLIWEDDIDFLTDNDPADHEVVWVKYSKDRKVEAAWSFWHSDILTTSRAAPDANANAGRVKINVQWGKHGSLLEGWEEKIGVDTPVPDFPRFETLQFERLHKGRHDAQGHYADRWPKRFEGDRDDFVRFSTEIDMVGKLDEHRMIVINRYANAVISQHFLPYNIRPKEDWPWDHSGWEHGNKD